MIVQSWTVRFVMVRVGRSKFGRLVVVAVRWVVVGAVRWVVVVVAVRWVVVDFGEMQGQLWGYRDGVIAESDWFESWR